MTFKNLCCHLHGWTKALESSRFRPPTHQQTRPAMPTSGSSASPANKPRQHPLSFRSMWQRSFIKKVEYRVESFCRLLKPTNMLFVWAHWGEPRKKAVHFGWLCGRLRSHTPKKSWVFFTSELNLPLLPCLNWEFFCINLLILIFPTRFFDFYISL